jgi:hypothetical protein
MPFTYIEHPVSNFYKSIYQNYTLEIEQYLFCAKKILKTSSKQSETTAFNNPTFLVNSSR